MRYTVFSCGVFYERFAPGGLAAYNLGASIGGGAGAVEGAFLVDLGRGTAEIPAADAAGRPVAALSLTPIRDLARVSNIPVFLYYLFQHASPPPLRFVFRPFSLRVL